MGCMMHVGGERVDWKQNLPFLPASSNPATSIISKNTTAHFIVQHPLSNLIPTQHQQLVAQLLTTAFIQSLYLL